MRVWRVVLLLLLFLAIAGPWTYERINVPSRYPCKPPYVRLEGDFCAAPLSGLVTLAWMASGLISSWVGLFTSATSLSQVGEELFTGIIIYLIILLLLLPLLTNIHLVLRGEKHAKYRLNVAFLGLAFLTALLIGLSSYPIFQWRLWGIWQYSIVAFAALIVEAWRSKSMISG